MYYPKIELNPNTSRLISLYVEKLTFFPEDLRRAKSGEIWKAVTFKEFDVFGRMVVDIHLTRDLQISALSIATRTHQKARANRVEQTIEGDYDADIVGAEGAFAAAAYLFDNWLVALDTIVIGDPDKGDLIFSDGTRAEVWRADVKTRSKAWHDILMIPKKQFEKNKYDYYVGCSEIDNETVRIHGWLSRADAEKFLETHDYTDKYIKGKLTLGIPFKELREIAELKKQIIRPSMAKL